MEKKIFIHAGPGKTGTSAIQYWLNNNIDVLKENGIFYPSHKVDANKVSCGNIQSIYDKESRSYFLNAERVEQLLKEFNCSEAHTLILSSELFFSRIDELLSIFENGQIIIYLRNPLELAESVYNQHVKRKRKIDQFSIGPKFKMPALKKFDELLTQYGSERIIVKPYLNSLFRKGSIVSDFLFQIGLDLDIGEPEIINSSYTFEALEFMRHLNHFDIWKTPKHIDEVLQACPVGVKNYSLIPEEVDRKLTDKILDDILSFSQKHGVDSLLPFVESLKVKKRKPYLKQHMSKKQFMDVAEYIKVNHPLIFQKISRVVNRNRNTSLPNPTFISCFRRHRVI